jgi:hypothetical protein
MTEWRQPSRGLVHERANGVTVDWFTPPDFFDRLGMTFDLDPCAGRDAEEIALRSSVPATVSYTLSDDGLARPWRGRAFVNPPYGDAMIPFLHRLAEHGDGVALVFARTETKAMQDAMRKADLTVFMRDRLYFVRASDGYQGRAACGSLLLVHGQRNVDDVLRADLGIAFPKADR